jgi:hypothetical protein
MWSCRIDPLTRVVFFGAVKESRKREGAKARNARKPDFICGGNSVRLSGELSRLCDSASSRLAGSYAQLVNGVLPEKGESFAPFSRAGSRLRHEFGPSLHWAAKACRRAASRLAARGSAQGTEGQQSQGKWTKCRGAISGQRSAVSDQQSAISSQRSAVSSQQSAVSSQQSAVSSSQTAIGRAER